MKLIPQPETGLRIVLDRDEAEMLDQLVTQLIQLLQSHSSTTLDPDPLFASLEVGGSDEIPDDPALARLFPNAYESDDDASEFRRVSEQGLINRKLQDAIEVTSALGLGGGILEREETIEVDIVPETLPAWVRTVTALRLAIAARIGLDEADDHDRLMLEEETRGTVLVFDWLAAILESVLAIMNGMSELNDADDSGDTSGSAGSGGPAGAGGSAAGSSADAGDSAGAGDSDSQNGPDSSASTRS